MIVKGISTPGGGARKKAQPGKRVLPLIATLATSGRTVALSARENARKHP
jgi:hypothetical protein